MITPLFNSASIAQNMNNFIAKFEKAVITALKRRGEQFVTECRNERTYQDQTGNLRSSIGYFIFKGSEKIAEGLQGNSEGVASAENFIRQYVKEPNTIYLIGVAGMNYAAAVEAKGYNVISNQSLRIVSIIEGDFQKIAKKLDL